MRIPRVLIASSLALLSVPSAAQERELACTLVATADPSLEDRWNHTSTDRFEARTTGYVHRGQRFLLAVFMQGYATRESGEADLVYDLRIARPDGTTYHESDGHPGWNRVVEDPGNVLLAESMVGCFFEPEDPVGTYTARVVLTDGLSGAVTTAETTVELVEYREGAGFDGREALESWAYGYAADPDPWRLLPAFRAHCRTGGFSEEGHWLDAFLLEAFEVDAWLLPRLRAVLDDGSAEERRGACWLLARIDVDEVHLLEPPSEGDAALLRALAAEARDPLHEPLLARQDVNTLYGRYLASRRRAPLLRLVLALDAEGGVISGESLHDERTGIDVPFTRVFPKVTRALVGQLLPWDPLALGYARGMLASDELPGAVRDVLLELVEEQE